MTKDDSWITFEGIWIYADDVITISNPRGKRITIQNASGKLDLKGHIVDMKGGPVFTGYKQEEEQ